MLMLLYIGIFFGYIVVAVVVTVALARFVGRLGSSGKAKAVVGLLSVMTFVLIPTWDVIPGKRYFAHVCETEAGLKIKKTVEGVEGFLDLGTGGLQGVDGKDFYDFGYKFFEKEGPGNKLYRYSGAKGKVVQEEIKEYKSKYGVRGSYWQLLPWNVMKNETVIFNVQTDEVLATYTAFHYSGNWVLHKLQLGHRPPCSGSSASK